MYDYTEKTEKDYRPDGHAREDTIPMDMIHGETDPNEVSTVNVCCFSQSGTRKKPEIQTKGAE